MLRDFENKAGAIVRGLKSVQDLRQVAVELDVNDGADDLRNAPCGLEVAMVRPH